MLITSVTINALFKTCDVFVQFLSITLHTVSVNLISKFVKYDALHALLHLR